MYVSALRASGYRNLEGTFPICAPLAILVCENNAGKSSVIDALRTVLEPEAGPQSRHWLREGDFKHNCLGERVVDELELEALTTFGLMRRVEDRSPRRYRLVPADELSPQHRDVRDGLNALLPRLARLDESD